MKNKKLFKHLPIAIMAAGLAVGTSIPLTYSLNNSNYSINGVLSANRQTDETNYSSQLEYIRNDVAERNGVTNSIVSIDVADSACTRDSSAAIVTKTDGSTLLYMWGKNDNGQLGFAPNYTPNATPILVDGANFDSKKIIQIVLGGGHSAVLLEDGSLYTWGSNRYGQLGNGTKDDTSTPTPVDPTFFDSKKITRISLGEHHSSAISDDGSLYMWGRNDHGQLGNGTTGETSTPTKIPQSAFESKKVTEVVLSQYFSAALLDDGSLYMWGQNDKGQLGNGTTDNAQTPKLANTTEFNSRKIKQMAVGSKHSAVLLDDGSLYMWGGNFFGQLGKNTNTGTENPNPIPTKVESAEFGINKITQISIGYSHSAALLEDGSLYMWGNNTYGQLGFTANSTANPIPFKLVINSASPFARVMIGDFYSAVILNDGSLYMWGNNIYGQLGNGTDATSQHTPTLAHLGMDSHITAKPAIKAKAAVDNLWVDDKFNLSGFKDSFNLINIPDVADQVITIDTKPTYDDVSQTVTMNIKIKYFYDENGLIVADTAANPMTIGGFGSTIKTTDDQFQWWWILAGVGGAAVVGLGLWFFLKKQNTGYRHRRMRGRYKSRRFK